MNPANQAGSGLEPMTRRQPRGLLGLGVALAVWFVSGVSAPGAPATSTLDESRNSKAVYYRNERLPQGPWSIHIVRIELGNPEYELQTMLANGTISGMTTLSEQVKALPSELGRPIAAINGDFYRSDPKPYGGDPQGLQILQGQLVSGPTDHACFFLDAAGVPHSETVKAVFLVRWPDRTTTPFGLNEDRPGDGVVLYTPTFGRSTGTREGGRELVLQAVDPLKWLPLRAGDQLAARVQEVRRAGDTPIQPGQLVLSLGPQLLVDLPEVKPGDTLSLSTATVPSLVGCQTALGGGPRLVADGKPVNGWRSPTQRHPRTAIGWNEKHLFLVLVDGRQPGLSAGMSFQELAAYFIQLGCKQAINLDGGGSASMWVRGQVVSSPSEGKERPIANGLVLLKKPRKEPRHP